MSPPRVEISIVRDEVFSFTPDDGDTEIHIYSGRLREWLHAKAMDKLVEVHFPGEETLDSIVRRHGLEQHRMDSMTEDEAREPVIVGLWPSGTHVLIDGGHRRWFWAKRGVHTLKGWVVPTTVWQHFTFSIADHLFAVHHRSGETLPHRRKK